MHGIQTMPGLRVLAAWHAFMQNLRRGHHEAAADHSRISGRRAVPTPEQVTHEAAHEFVLPGSQTRATGHERMRRRVG
jgi:hypothetical protein